MQTVPCRDEQEARRRADKALAPGGKVVGAHVLSVVVDEVAGEYDEPRVIAAFGEVPEAA